MTMTAIAEKQKPAPSRPRRRKTEPPCPCVAVEPGERVVYGLVARKDPETGFGYGRIADVEVFDPVLETDVLVSYVRAGQPGREYLLVFGQQVGPAKFDRRFESDGHQVVRPIDRADRQAVIDALRSKKGLTETVFFW
jgi:hypothetical protein